MSKLRKNTISLSITHPKLVQEWDYEKNAPLTPENMSGGSTKKVWWRCPHGHSYEASISSRTRQSCNCPYCSGHRAISGVNDLQTTYPQIAEEWHPTKNGELKPCDVMPGSNKKVWWFGKCGHEWQAYIYPRTSKGVGCPKCKQELHTSFSEQAVYYYAKKYYSDSINGDSNAIGMELDVYIPSIRVAVEYDGMAYHSRNRKHDVDKNAACKAAGIKLIRIQEIENNQYDDCICLVRNNDRSKRDLTQIIKKMFSIIGNDAVDIDVIRDEQKILALYMTKKGEKSLAAIFPEIAKEWHPTKNGFLTPDKVVSGSVKSVWWLGNCGHEWRSRIAPRTKGIGCPYCNKGGSRVLVGVSDLMTCSPEISKEWNYVKNAGLKNGFNEDISTPDRVNVGSDQVVWWIGKCGHEWDMKISDRTGNKHAGCPYCSNHRLLVGFNDLASRYPEIAKEWHPTKNGDLTPDRVFYGSGRKVWWLGKCGHEWSIRVVARTVVGAGCPFCSGAKGVRVECIETGVIYDNLSEAAEAMNTYKASIVNCCKGRQNKAGGYHWRYADEQNK